MTTEPTKKELEKIEKELSKGIFFDEEFDDFDNLTNWGDEDILGEDE